MLCNICGRQAIARREIDRFNPNSRELGWRLRSSVVWLCALHRKAVDDGDWKGTLIDHMHQFPDCD